MCQSVAPAVDDALALPDADVDAANINVAAADAAYVGKLVSFNTIDVLTGRSAHPEADGAIGVVTAYHTDALPHGTYTNSAAHARLDGQSYTVHSMAVELVSDSDKLAQCRVEAHLVLHANMSSDRAMRAANLIHGLLSIGPF